MASSASPLASFSNLLADPVLIRPSVPQRTASSRSLPTKSTLPRITIVFPSARIPHELVDGVKELANTAVRGNVAVVEGERAPQGGGGAFVWGVEFEKREDFDSGAMKISSNYDDFANLPQGAQFTITISYSRPIEAFRGIGHILAISRSLASFTGNFVPRTASDRPRDSPMDEDPNPISGNEGENTGSIDVEEMNGQSP
ncbi:hypothetical protein JCM5353_002710, partial [Sporobolomyces roseus]